MDCASEYERLCGDERLFRADTDWQFNACINSTQPSLDLVALSYKEGAETLARVTAAGKATLDLTILPIVYLYRQYLELTIKDIIETARSLEQAGEGYPKHHNLKKLWAEAKRLIGMHYGQDTPPEVDHVDACINEFDEHDPESFSFRYPTDKRGHPNLCGIKLINLRNLYETMGRLSFFLDSIADHLGVRLQCTYEMQAEYAP